MASTVTGQLQGDGPAHPFPFAAVCRKLPGTRALPERTPGERTPFMTDSVPLTYKELAERLGISPDSARIKAKRRKWAVIPGNHPSEPVRVLVPVAVLEGERSPERSGGERSGALPRTVRAKSAPYRRMLRR
jgi:hypothetical protein